MIAEGHFNGDIILAALVAVTLYIYLAALFEHRKSSFVHETGVAIVIGFIMGLFGYFLLRDFFLKMLALDDQIIFYMLLPPMLFADGFNLKKRRFFQNLFYINVYGIIGTVFNFLTTACLLLIASECDIIRDFNNFSNPRRLQTWQVLLFSACMCSIDPVASLSEIKPQSQPKLFSIIFGQSLLKDAVTIALYKSIEQLVRVNGSVDLFGFKWYTPFVIFGTFCLMMLTSAAIGIFFGLLLTVIFKLSRFVIKDRGVTEVSLIFLTGYMSYLVSQLSQFSGVVTMLVCGLTLSHFNIYNMSQEGVNSSKVTFESISIIAEGLLFLLLGVSSWSVRGDSQQGYVISISATFILVSLVILVISRIVNIFLMSLLFRMIKGKQKWRLNRYELQIIFASGLVRGAVPFALTTSTALIDEPVKVTSLLVRSTVIITVLFTSLVINGLLPMFIRNRLKIMQKKVPQDHPSLFDSLITSNNDNDEEILPPSTERHWRSKSQRIWRRFEQQYLKPFLIYKYRERKQEIKKEKKRLREQELRVEKQEQEDKPKKFKEDLEDMNLNDDGDDEHSDSYETRSKGKRKFQRQKKKSKNTPKGSFNDYIPTNQPT